MKLKIYLPLAGLILAACQNSGSGSHGQCLAPQNSQDPFVAGKVQVSQLPIPGTNDVSPLADGQTIRAGNRLAVVMKDACLLESGGLDRTAAGAIAVSLKTEGHLRTPAGEQTYTWMVPQTLSATELQEMASADECIVGIGDDATATLEDTLFQYENETEEAAASADRAADGATVEDEFADDFTDDLTGDLVSDEQKTYALSINDPYAPNQGHLKMLQASNSYNVFYNSDMGINKASVIAVIDTGIDMNHPDLKTRLWTNPREIPGNGRDDDRNGYIDDVNGYNFASRRASPSYQGSWSMVHHGTHVAGLAVAQSFNNVGVSGVMGWGARVMMLNVFGASSGAAVANTANAIRYAADNGAHVINMSIGGMSNSSIYRNAIAYAIKKGVTIIAAAGNSSRRISSSYYTTPAAYARDFAGMLAIGSIDSSSLRASRFTNYGSSFVELAAPGSENSYSYYGLLSTMPKGRYARASGTSMASPIAAGAAGIASAMLRSRGYQSTPDRIERILRNSARKVSSLTGYFLQGNILNMQNIAVYINRYYPDLRPQGLPDDGKQPDIEAGEPGAEMPGANEGDPAARAGEGSC